MYIVGVMVRSRRPSPQMLAVLAALYEQAPERIHGYDLMKQTGLKSGSLYPLLMRMTDRGLLSSEWCEPSAPGRPPRHAYRLTADGVALAREVKSDPRAFGLGSAKA
ncbi:PadR family transcriptional regulator [Citromicrobium bathyomarinum]|uniref:PadR family transcriptional regulator n=1 Tax=Citromicrobium bathyomarinum TaxID=72174 RepID=UPI00315A5782